MLSENSYFNTVIQAATDIILNADLLQNLLEYFVYQYSTLILSVNRH